MNNHIYLSFFLLVFITFAARIAYSQQPNIQGAPYELVKKAVQNAKESDKWKKNNISFRKLRTEEELNRGRRSKSPKSYIDNTHREPSYHGNGYPPEIIENELKFMFNFSGLLLQAYDYAFVNKDSPERKMLLDQYNASQYADECDNCDILKFWPKENQPTIEQLLPEDHSSLDFFKRAEQAGAHAVAMRQEGILFIERDFIFVRRFIARLKESYRYKISVTTWSEVDTEFILRRFQGNTDIILSLYSKLSYQVKFFIPTVTRREKNEYECYFFNTDPIPTECQPSVP